MVPDQPRRTSLDILLDPTKYQSTYGVFTVQTPRWALDSKDSSGADIPFRVTMDGNDLFWSELQVIKDHRVLGLYLAAKMPCCKSMGPKVL
jgi:hypothetical protein